MPTEHVTLRLGGREVTLHRSTHFVGVRPKRNAQAAVGRALAAFSGPNANPAELGPELGGFRLVELAATSPAKTGLRLDILRADAAVDVATGVFHSTPNDKAPLVPTGEIFIRFRPDAPAAARQAVLDRWSLTVREGRDPDTLICRTSAASPNPLATAQALQQDPFVAVAEPDLASWPQRLSFVMPTDSLLRDQWHLRNQGVFRGSSFSGITGADARVVAAWQALGSLGSPDVVVAVIDDGFDLKHPDLRRAGKVVHPRDFTRGGNDPKPGPGDWHGTACAGVACADAAAGHVLGAAPGVTLMPVRWGRDLSGAEVVAWFDHVTNNGAAVVSCSWKAEAAYFSLYPDIADAIARCARQGRGGKGCVVVFAAGNDNVDIDGGGTLNGFAVHPDVIAVAACNSRDRRSEYSNFGDAIWIAAPSSSAEGWGILTADVTGNGTHGPLGYSDGDYTWTFGGTSSSTPLVAGIAALMLTANPNLTAAEVRAIIARTARRIGPANAYVGGRSRLYGHGCIDAEAAVRAALQGGGQ